MWQHSLFHRATINVLTSAHLSHHQLYKYKHTPMHLGQIRLAAMLQSWNCANVWIQNSTQLCCVCDLLAVWLFTVQFNFWELMFLELLLLGSLHLILSLLMLLLLGLIQLGLLILQLLLLKLLMANFILRRVADWCWFGCFCLDEVVHEDLYEGVYNDAYDNVYGDVYKDVAYVGVYLGGEWFDTMLKILREAELVLPHAGTVVVGYPYGWASPSIHSIAESGVCHEYSPINHIVVVWEAILKWCIHWTQWKRERTVFRIGTWSSCAFVLIFISQVDIKLRNIVLGDQSYIHDKRGEAIGISVFSMLSLWFDATILRHGGWFDVNTVTGIHFSTKMEWFDQWNKCATIQKEKEPPT